jgi:solute:Na+ symporter, SSS family
MSIIDWIVMLGTLLGIAAYGIYKTRHVNSAKSYLVGDRQLPWWTIGLSIMATQASAITFLSTPGQAYEDGLRFVQFYFGMPIAMIILSIFVLPIYYKLNVYTPYEYLEQRFNIKTRSLTALLFLVQRGLAAGLTIYAPSIVLSSILGWSLNFTIVFIGLIVILYTMSGGTTAVSITQKQQMIVIMSGLFLAAVMIVWKLPADLSFPEAVDLAGHLGKLNAVTFEFNLKDRYNIWSGMIASVFLFLSYFGTDHSQVSRYLSGRSLTESRLGLMFNGMLKVPMQFLILFVGVLVFVFYQFNQPPVHFNETNLNKLKGTAYEAEYQSLSADFTQIFNQKQQWLDKLITASKQEDQVLIQQARQNISQLEASDQQIRTKVKALIQSAAPEAKTKDTDYVFLSFVMTYMPVGVVGLLLAMIFAAGMSSTSSELNALTSVMVVDFYQRHWQKGKSDAHYLLSSKLFTVMWGMLALLFAATAQLFENLIQMVNILGSVFYGTILGVFMTAFFLKKVGGKAVFPAALITQVVIIALFFMERNGLLPISFLWYNPIGCLLVMGLSLIFQALDTRRYSSETD